MYNYMRALEDRFTPKPNNKRRQELETKRQEVAALLDKQGKKKLLRLVDAHTMVQEGNGAGQFRRQLPSGLGDFYGAGGGRQIFL